jgi:hypothetical protein
MHLQRRLSDPMTTTPNAEMMGPWALVGSDLGRLPFAFAVGFSLGNGLSLASIVPLTASAETLADIARSYNVSPATISRLEP